MTDSMLVAEFAELSWCEWCSIVRDDLLRVAQHGENFSMFTHCVDCVCVLYLFCTTVFTVGIDLYQLHRSIDRSCIIYVCNRCHGPEEKSHTDRGDFPGSFELCAHVKHWEQRRSMSASIPGHHTRERGRPFIRTILMCVSWRRFSIVNLNVWGTTTWSPQSKILSSIVSFSLRRWYGRSSSDGHLSGQPRSTKFKTFERMGFLRVAILHWLESIWVDSLRET